MRTIFVFTRLYGFFLHLYPVSFRETYGEEMTRVMAQMLTAARARGVFRAWGIFLRELAELPIHALAAHFSTFKVDAIIEGILTNPRRTRWQQAGSLAFALAFALLEFLNGLAQLFQTGLKPYTSWNGWTNVTLANTPQGTIEAASFQALAIPMFLISGLAAGFILRKAGTPPRPPRYVLGVALSMPGGYVLLYACSLLVRSMPFLTVSLSFAFNLLAIVVLGAWIAFMLGLLTGELHPGRLARLTLAGFSGFALGLLAYFLMTLVLEGGFVVIGYLVHIQIFQQVFNSPLASWVALGSAIAGSAAMGWVFGGWVGKELDPSRQEKMVILPGHE